MGELIIAVIIFISCAVFGTLAYREASGKTAERKEHKKFAKI